MHNGEVMLEWATESEINNAGFNLYSAESNNSNFSKITISLIPGNGISTQGATYGRRSECDYRTLLEMCWAST